MIMAAQYTFSCSGSLGFVVFKESTWHMTKNTADRLRKQSTPSASEAKVALSVEWSRLFSSALLIMSLGFVEWNFPGRFFLRDKTYGSWTQSACTPIPQQSLHTPYVIHLCYRGDSQSECASGLGQKKWRVKEIKWNYHLCSSYWYIS